MGLKPRKNRPFGLRHTPYNPVTGQYLDIFQKRKNDAVTETIVCDRARCQEGFQNDGKIAVVLVDVDGVETGDVFDVWMFIDRRTVGYNSVFLTTIEYGNNVYQQIVPITKLADGQWHLSQGFVRINPIFLAICKENIQADGLIAVRLVNSYGAEVGDIFDVWEFVNRRTVVDISSDVLAVPEYGTDLSGKIVNIVQAADGQWHLAPNTIVVRGECSS